MENDLLEFLHSWVVADPMSSVLPTDVVVPVEDDHAGSLDDVSSDVLGAIEQALANIQAIPLRC